MSSDQQWPEFSVPQGQSLGQFGDVNVLAADKLAVPGRPKPKRTRREPKVYITDNAGGSSKFVNTNKDQNDAAIPLDQAIQMGLVKPEHVNKNPKLDYDPKEVKVEPAPFEKEKSVAKDPNDEINLTAEQKIAQAVAQAPVVEDASVAPAFYEDPLDNMTPEEILTILAAAITYERKCGTTIHLVDQDGNKIHGLQIVRDKPEFIGM
ncbi:MAG: hypothetical protein HRU21_09280 [Pseudomonadales bacterium]|nr:hypothetical protein [Pseudomonadales bacterium]